MGAIRGTLPKIRWEKVKVVELSEEVLAERESSKRKTVVKQTKKKKDSDALELDVIQRALKSDKPVLFYVHGNCSDGRADVACKTMVNLVLRQPTVVKLSKHFHNVEIDASKIDKDIAKRYKLRHSPSIVFVDPDRSILGGLKGKPAASTLETTMKKILKDAGKKKAARAKKAARDKKRAEIEARKAAARAKKKDK